MAMFLAEIAFLLELALFAAGLVLWHKGREATAGLLRGAGAVLVVGAVLTSLCTGYFSVRYHVQGEFDHAYPAAPGTLDPGGAPGCPRGTAPGMMGSGGMGPGMMEPGMRGMPMRPGAQPSEPGPAEPEAEE